MKRVVFFLILALVSCLGAPAVFSQGWMPVPPTSAMPQTGVPMPIMGQPGGMPGLDPSCLPMPTCPPQPCAPPKNASIGGLVGWQPHKDIGCIKFSTRGMHLIQKTGTKIDFALQGIWVGASARMEMGDRFSVRGEYRHLFPTKEHSDTITPINIGAPGSRGFERSRYDVNVIDGSAAMSIANGISLLSGFRWDKFDLSMQDTIAIPLFSSPPDEGNLTLSSLQPYGGAELAFTTSDSGILLRVIGSPWVSTRTEFGLTFGNGGVPIRGPIRDWIKVDSRWSSFIEASAFYGRRVSDNVTAGVFGIVNSLSAHAEADMKSTRLAGFGPLALPEVHVSVPFDVDLSRLTFILGGNVAVAFGSPL